MQPWYEQQSPFLISWRHATTVERHFLQNDGVWEIQTPQMDSICMQILPTLLLCYYLNRATGKKISQWKR